MIKFIKKSSLTGNINEMLLPLTTSELIELKYDHDELGKLIQNCRHANKLDADQREFIMTGTTPYDWANLFGGSDEN